MDITIYDFMESSVTFTVPDNKIEKIKVEVITGDEVVTIYFADGTDIKKDSSDCRIYNSLDYIYFVEGEKVNEWIEWVPNDENNESLPYARAHRFRGDYDDDNDDDIEETKNSLKSCPCCGSTNVETHEVNEMGYFFTGCNDRGLNVEGDTAEETINAWNKRVK